MKTRCISRQAKKKKKVIIRKLKECVNTTNLVRKERTSNSQTRQGFIYSDNEAKANQERAAKLNSRDWNDYP